MEEWIRIERKSMKPGIYNLERIGQSFFSGGKLISMESRKRKQGQIR